MDIVQEALKEALEPPDSYFGAINDLQSQGWARVWSRHRDSDNINISNYETVLQAFSEKYELNDDYRVEGSSHWLVGWMDEILVRALDCGCKDWENADIFGDPEVGVWSCRTCGDPCNVTDIFIDAINFAESVKEYPLLDETDYCRREHEELMEWLEDQVSSVIRHTEGEKTEEDWEPDLDKVFSYLFDTHSVSSVEDCDWEWVEDAVLAVADQEGKKL